MQSLNIGKRNVAQAWLQGWERELNKTWVNQEKVKWYINIYSKQVAHYETIAQELDTLHAQNPTETLLILCFSEYNENSQRWGTRRIACHSVRDAFETYDALSITAQKHYHFTTGILELRSREEERRIKELQNQIDEYERRLNNLKEEFDILTKGEEDEY